jgi:ATP-dependent helicase/nuclease subunit B
MGVAAPSPTKDRPLHLSRSVLCGVPAILTAMFERVFLGWDSPFLPRVVEKLWDRRGELPRMLVVVPTAQSGRRLRLALAERANAEGRGVLAPRVVTPPGLIAFPGEANVAAQAVELMAWVDAIESIRDWEELSEAIPEPPGTQNREGWAFGLARMLAHLHRELETAGATISELAAKASPSIDAARWRALARLEERLDARLQELGLVSRCRALANRQAVLRHRCDRVVIAGVADLAGIAAELLGESGAEVEVWIAAPEAEAEGFDAVGRPKPEAWHGRKFQWPERGGVELLADARQQAERAVAIVREAGTPSEDLALGSADERVASELERVFARAGWVLFDAAGGEREGALARWLRVWRTWLLEPRMAMAAELLALPGTARLVGGRLAQKACALAKLRDRFLVETAEDLRRATGLIEKEVERAEAAEVAGAIDVLCQRRVEFQTSGFAEAVGSLLSAAARTDAEEGDAEELDALLDLAESIGAAAGARDAAFCLDVLLTCAAARKASPPAERAGDISGWLELPFDPGRHLVLCGMNEGFVPAPLSGDAWLGAKTRELLGLPGEREREARDAFLLRSLVEAREHDGRVDLLCGKVAASGEVMLPSRHLLAGRREKLPARVERLFATPPNPEAGLHWTLDWQLRPRRVAFGGTLDVTAAGDYLECPFRFYLKHLLKMRHSEPERGEWNAKDFGVVVHEVLEEWGCDEEAREWESESRLLERFNAGLDAWIERRFGATLPLAMEIQRETARRRLAWFARAQATERARGWRIERAEERFQLEIAGAIFTGKIDRIEVRDGALRVVDYKTGKPGKVAAAHGSAVRKGTRIGEHVAGDERAFFELESNEGTSLRHVWRNLQLPLYALWVRERTGETPGVVYAHIGDTAADVRFCEWEGIDNGVLDAAERCAAMVIEKVGAGEFWPPAERVKHDDLDEVLMGHPAAEVFAGPSSWIERGNG